MQTETGTVCVNHLGEWSAVRVRSKVGNDEEIGASQGSNTMEYEMAAFVELVQSGKQQESFVPSNV